MRGNLTDPLNWLLRELSSPVVAYQYMPEGQTTSPLGARSAHFRQRVAADLADRRRQQGQPADLPAADGKALQTHWPFGLRARRSRHARRTSSPPATTFSRR